jgi:hypothetical protein
VKNLEIAYLLTAYAMGAVIYYINRRQDYLTVSETAAHSKIGRQTFFWGLLASGILFLFLMFGWLIPHYDFGGGFSALVIVLFIFQVLTGLIPARGKIPNILHLVCAFGLGLTMIVVVFAFVTRADINSIVQIICAVLGTVMIGLLATTHKISATKYFRHQNIFFACWHIALFIVVYFG